jgi:DNA-3-methyladenine glycosylase II
MTGVIATEDDIARAAEALAQGCPVMAAIIPRAGPIPLRRRAPGFEGLCRIIIGQQVSVASADAIWGRFASTFAPFAPAAIHAASDAAFAAAGLSRPKMRTLRAAAGAIISGDLPLAALAETDADTARRLLVAVKGVGPWTADVYALLCLGHADAFAPGDLALQEAARLAFGHETRPSAGELATLALRWRPHRGTAARVLWAYYAAMKRREGVA